MIIDSRKRSRKIEIKFETTGGNFDIDFLIDNLLPDLKTIIYQRDLPKELKIIVTLE